MNLCIVQPRKLNQRGSFVDYHVSLLHPSIELYNGWYPFNSTSQINFQTFPFRNKIFSGFIKRFFPGKFHKLYTSSISKLLIENRISCGLIEYGPTAANVADAFTKAEIPFAVHFHGFDAYHYDTINKYKQPYIRMFAQATIIIAVSLDMKAQLVSIGADEKKIIINHYGVDEERFNGANASITPPNLIFVGRFTEKKSPSDLINAFEIAHNKINNSKLTLVGYGELLDSTKKLVKQKGLEESVIFAGSKNHSEIIEFLRNARAFVQHSKRASNGDSEGLPNSILEASAAGLPVISTFHAGIPEAVIHEKTGFLVKEGDYVNMAKYMVQLLENAELAGKMGQAGREYIVLNFNLSKQISNLKKVLENISL